MNPEQHTPPSEHEQSPESLPQIFDMEHMESGQVEALIGAIGVALGQSIDKEHQHGNKIDFGSTRYDQLLRLVAHDTQRLIHDDLERATEVFARLVQSRSPWVRQFAVDDMAGDLLRSYPEDSPVRQWLLEQWVAQLNVGPEDVDADDNLVREAADHTLSDVVWSDWVDEPTARYLNSKLPSHSQRHEWQ
jgi:hypothetical protein